MVSSLVRCALISALLLSGGLGVEASEKIVIAHRGASGYLPEHTLEAYAVAHAMGADYVEPDLVMTKDGHLISLHDIHLDSTTDVAGRFPERKRDDGHWFAADFTLAEIKTLSVKERLNDRFPKGKSHFEIPTLEEVIELVQGMNATTGRNTGIYPELKQPSFHRAEGLPLEARVLDILSQYGYEGPEARVFVQCFEAESLRMIRKELHSSLPLIQLVSGDKRQAEMWTQEGLAQVAEYANGIGPDKNLIEKNPAYVAWAHDAQLLVHPYTLRVDDCPEKYATPLDEFRQFYVEYGVDGVFTDFPDTAVRSLLDNQLR